MNFSGEKLQRANVPREVFKNHRDLLSSGQLWGVAQKARRIIFKYRVFRSYQALQVRELHSCINRICFVYFANCHIAILRERYQATKHKQPTWKTPVPESHKLTDADVDAFVNSMMPIAMIGIFNKRCSYIFFDALHYLCVMRPSLVIPNVLEKVYPTLGSDIEPHKLLTAMSCMIAIARPLVQGSRILNKGTRCKNFQKFSSAFYNSD